MTITPPPKKQIKINVPDPSLAFPPSELRVPVRVLRRREVKWLDMLENWEKWMLKRSKKVKERCRKGIPPSLRSRAWQYLSGSKYLMDSNKGRYDVSGQWD
jgi:hypothetical protein